MKLHWYNFLTPWDFESHQSWLAGQASKGLHYKSRILGFDRFQAGTPGAFSFCWDRAPAFGKAAKEAYTRSRAEAGWQAVAETGNLVCWRRAAEAGQPAPVLHDEQDTRRMLKRIFNDHLLWATFITYFTLRAYFKLLSDDPFFRIGHSIAAIVGTLGLAFGAYSLLRLKKRT